MLEFILNHICSLLILAGSFHAFGLISHFQRNQTKRPFAFGYLRKAIWYFVMLFLCFNYLGSLSQGFDKSRVTEKTALPSAEAGALKTPLGRHQTRALSRP